MTATGTLYSRLSYGTGTALAGAGVSVKTHAGTFSRENWCLPGAMAELTLNDWAIVTGIACTLITCAVNGYYRYREREDRRHGDDKPNEK